MNAPREPDDRDDELLAAYRRASVQEGHGPSARVRESILAQVRRAHAPAAANDGRWRARAAAGVAVLGLVGWLALHGLRNAPRNADSTIDTDSMTAATAAKSAPPAPPAPPALAAADVRTDARVASSAAPARRSAAQPRASAPGDEALIRRAVTARFAGLFLPADSDRLNLVIVLLDRSGGVVRSAVTTASASAAQDAEPAPAGDFQSLGLRADEIAAPGFIRLVEKAAAAGAPDKLLLVRYAWTTDAGQ